LGELVSDADISRGGFCGYRNIQMMVSYIVGSGSYGVEQLGNQIPSIFDIQDYIETAWDQGINSKGRIETGGVRGTRKYIGTPEVSHHIRGGTDIDDRHL
jgi:zinc finger-containing ubiquitin peptidase 1